MRYYELLYIVNSNFERKKIDEAMNEIDSKIKKTNSKIINHIIWGKKKLAYKIQGNKYGTYILVHYQGGEKDKLDDLDSWLKLSDLVIRHMIVRLESEPDVLEKIEDTTTEEEKVDIKPDKKELPKNNNDEESEGEE